MPRLLRPHIPLEVRCRVALRQLGEMWPEQLVDNFRDMPGGLGNLLSCKLAALAWTLGCEAKDLHLDHDPALGAREKVFRKGVHVGYKPAANDPEFLYYREAVAHRVKTNVRGAHGQHPDRVLIKKQRRLEKRTRPTPTRSPQKPSRANHSTPKQKWTSRPLRSASRWPKGRKIQNRNNLRKRQ